MTLAEAEALRDRLTNEIVSGRKGCVAKRHKRALVTSLILALKMKAERDQAQETVG